MPLFRYNLSSCLVHVLFILFTPSLAASQLVSFLWYLLLESWSWGLVFLASYFSCVTIKHLEDQLPLYQFYEMALENKRLYHGGVSKGTGWVDYAGSGFPWGFSLNSVFSCIHISDVCRSLSGLSFRSCGVDSQNTTLLGGQGYGGSWSSSSDCRYRMLEVGSLLWAQVVAHMTTTYNWLVVGTGHLTVF